MRSFIQEISKLVIDPSHGRTSGIGKVTDVYNFKATAHGLELYTPFEKTFQGYGTHPYPYIFEGREYTYLFTGANIYVIDGSTLLIMGKAKEEHSGAPNTLRQVAPSFADLGEYFVISDGIKTYYGSGRSRVYSEAYTNISAVAEYKGRLILAGIDYNSAWSPSWISYFNQQDSTPAEASKSTIIVTPVMSDYFWLFEEPTDRVRDLMYNNETFLHKAPFNDQIVKVAPLGESLVLYGEKNTALVSMIIQPAIALKNAGLLDTAINIESSPLFTINDHLCLNSKGDLIVINSEGLKDLGYRDIMSILDNTVKILKDRITNEYYITDFTNVFCLNEFGLTRVKDSFTALYTHNNQTLGV
jgi:hypothetical protein